MKLELLEDLYAREISEALFAEKRTLQVMPRFLEAVRNDDLRELFERHQKETQQQVSDLEGLTKSFEDIGSQQQGIVINALLAEAELVLKADAEPDIKEAAMIFAAQKIEGNEITCYGGLESMAKTLGRENDAKVLARILAQEKKMSQGLFAVAEEISMEAIESEETA